jgi:ribosome-binding factor A
MLFMTVAGHRHERIAEEIHHEISAMVAGELKDPRIIGLVTVTEVRVSPDLKLARIFVSVLGSEEEHSSTLKGLAAAAGFVRRELGVRLQIRRSPELLFIDDRSEEYKQRIDELLRESKRQQES